MPEETEVPTEETEEVQETSQETKEEKKDETPDEIKNLRREAAGYRTRLRTVEKERDDALTELKEAREGSEGTSARVTDLERENARLKVAIDKGVPKELVSRLVGSNEEELAADADQLLALLGPERKGLHDNGTRQTIEPPDLDTQIAEAEKAGNWPLARTLKSHKAFKQANT
jgi:chromosome segregation ATPase